MDRWIHHQPSRQKRACPPTPDGVGVVGTRPSCPSLGFRSARQVGRPELLSAPSFQRPWSAISKAAPHGMATPSRLIYVCSKARSRGRLRSGMAKLIFVANVSLDGYIEDAHGSIEWTAPIDEVFTFITDLVRPVGTYLYGRRMYETMAVWETEPALAAESELRADFANLWQAADKIVYSTTLPVISTANTRLERRFEPDAVRDMKTAAASDLTVGGPTLAAHAFKAGLVDECQLFIHPVLVGGGKPAIPATPASSWNCW